MLIILLAFLTSVAGAESPNPPRAGHYEARGTVSYFTTGSNYTSDGSQDLFNGGEFTNWTGELSFTYDWRPDWRFSGGVNGGYSESDDGFFTRSNSGANEVFASAQKWFESGPLDIAPQADFIFPLWRVDEGGDDALIGEGAMRLRAGSWAFWPRGTFKPFGYLGFEYRDEGRAFLLPYSVGVKLKVSQFWIQGEYRGFETIVDDSDTDNQAVRDVYLNRVNGGSYRFYSINPAASEFAAEAGTRLGDFGLFAGFAITVNGKNAADGYTGYGGISWSPTGHRRRDDDDGFNIRGERYDESLFHEQRNDGSQFIEDPNFKEPKTEAVTPDEPVDSQPVVPPDAPAAPEPPPKPVDVQVELKRVPPKRKKPAVKKPKRVKKKKNVDKMLNDAEKFLEKGG